MLSKTTPGKIRCPRCGVVNWCPCDECKKTSNILALGGVKFIRTDKGWGPVVCGACKKVIREN